MKHHYVYRVTSLTKNKHYYGSRTSIVPPKEDLGIKYFTSSTDREFRNGFKSSPHNYKVKVVSTFKTREEAMLLEIRLHARFDVGKNSNFYNKSKQITSGFSTEGTYLSDEHKLKISGIGRKHTDEARSRISKANKGKIRTDEARLNISEAHKGIKASDETRSKMSKARIGKKIVVHPKTREIKHIQAEELSKWLEEGWENTNYSKGSKRTDETKIKISKGLSEYNIRNGVLPPSKATPVIVEGKTYSTVKAACEYYKLTGYRLYKLYRVEKVKEKVGTLK